MAKLTYLGVPQTNWLWHIDIPKMQSTRCYVSQFFYFNKMLYMFRQFLRPSSGAQTIHTASGICQTLLLPAAIPTMTAAGSSKVWKIPQAVCIVWAPDDGQRNCLKHVEHFIEIKKLRNIASCWLHFGNILKMHGLMNIKYGILNWALFHLNTFHENKFYATELFLTRDTSSVYPDFHHHLHSPTLCYCLHKNPPWNPTMSSWIQLTPSLLKR
jgi:hypothetical protein